MSTRNRPSLPKVATRAIRLATRRVAPALFVAVTPWTVVVAEPASAGPSEAVSAAKRAQAGRARTAAAATPTDGAAPTPALDRDDLDLEALARAAKLALECAHQEYPNKIAHVMSSDADVKPPRELTPAFFGCFDWHSAVHGHWLLARLAHLHPAHPLAAPAKDVLETSLTPANLEVEVGYFRTEGRASFERPYGLAWLLQLGAELREWEDPDAARWSAALEPLEREIASRLKSWLGKLAYPIRVGEHSQTAFAFGLIHDWAWLHDMELAALVERKSRAFYAADRDCPLAYEPGGQDFLSPCLAEADLMRRFLEPPAFAAWLGGFLPGLPLHEGDEWLPVARVTDRADGKLAHLDGLNLARAWMLEGIAAGLPEEDPRRGALLAAAEIHATAGLASLRDPHYAGGHWLGSFAAYLLTERGLPGPRVLAVRTRSRP